MNQRIWMLLAVVAIALLAIIAYVQVASLQLTIADRDATRAAFDAATMTRDAVLAQASATANAIRSSRIQTATRAAVATAMIEATTRAHEPTDLAYSTSLAETMTAQGSLAAATNTAAALNDLLTTTPAP